MYRCAGGNNIARRDCFRIQREMLIIRKNINLQNFKNPTVFTCGLSHQTSVKGLIDKEC